MGRGSKTWLGGIYPLTPSCPPEHFGYLELTGGGRRHLDLLVGGRRHLDLLVGGRRHLDLSVQKVAAAAAAILNLDLLRGGRRQLSNGACCLLWLVFLFL